MILQILSTGLNKSHPVVNNITSNTIRQRVTTISFLIINKLIYYLIIKRIITFYIIRFGDSNPIY